MIAKIVIIFAAFAAVHATGLIGGAPIYGLGHVGTVSAQSAAISHVAPVASLAYAAPVAYGHGIAAAPLAYGVGAPLAYGHGVAAAPLAYGHGLIGGARYGGYGLGLGHGLVGGARYGLGLGHGLVGGARYGLGLGHGAGLSKAIW